VGSRYIGSVEEVSARIFGNAPPTTTVYKRSMFGLLRYSPDMRTVYQENYLDHPNAHTFTRLPGVHGEQTIPYKEKMEYKKSRGFMPVQKGSGKRAAKAKGKSKVTAGMKGGAPAADAKKK